MDSFDCLNEICELSETEYVISKSLKNYKDNKQNWEFFVSNLNYLFVGDNPGAVERENGEYFCYISSGNKKLKSKTGENTHKFIESFLCLSDDKVLFLNKSLRWTNETTELYLTESSKDKSMPLTAKLIRSISNENKNVFVCIFGLDSFKAEYFESFFNNLSLDEKNIGLYPHPSRRQPISKKEQENFANGYDKQKVFKIYGQLRYSNETKSLIERCKEEYKKE